MCLQDIIHLSGFVIFDGRIPVFKKTFLNGSASIFLIALVMWKLELFFALSHPLSILVMQELICVEMRGLIV